MVYIFQFLCMKYEFLNFDYDIMCFDLSKTQWTPLLLTLSATEVEYC